MLSMRQKRFLKEVNAIIEEELRKGNLPSSDEFAERVTRMLLRSSFNEPLTRFTMLHAGDIASSTFHNQVRESIQADLKVLYEQTIEAEEEMYGKLKWFEIEKNKLDNKVKRLKQDLEDKILTHSNTGYLYSVFDAFSDNSKIAEIENVTVDVDKSEVRLSNLKGLSFVIKDQPAVEIAGIDLSTKKLNVFGSPQDIFDPNKEGYIEVWMSKEDVEQKMVVTSSFENEVEINRILFSLSTKEAAECEFYISRDGVNEFCIGNARYDADNQTHSIVLAPQPVKKIRIEIKKERFDQEIEHPSGYKYEYVFAMKRLEFYQEGYFEEGQFISEWLSPQNSSFALDRVSLHTEDFKPIGTDIDYYIRASEEESWREIVEVNDESGKQGNRIIDFKINGSRKNEHIAIKSDAIEKLFEVVELSKNGTSFFKVFETSDKMVEKSEIFYMGRNGFTERTSALLATGEPTVEEWKTNFEFKKRIYTIVEGKQSLLLDKYLNTEQEDKMYETNIYATKEQVLNFIPISNAKISIYVNGEKIFSGEGDGQQAVLITKRGWNQIIVLVKIEENNRVTSVDIGFDVRLLGDYCYAVAEPLQKVTVFDLQNNVKSNDWSKYAISEKGEVITNYFQPSIEYDFSYRYTKKEEADKVQVRAVLKRTVSGTYVTPILKKYTLNFT